MLNPNPALRRGALLAALLMTMGCQAQPEATAVAEDPSLAQPCSVAPAPVGTQRVASTPVRRAASNPCVDVEDHEAAIAHIDGLLEEIETEDNE